MKRTAKEIIDKIDEVIPKFADGSSIPDRMRFSIDVFVIGNIALDGAYTVIKNISYDAVNDAVIIEVGSEV